MTNPKKPKETIHEMIERYKIESEIAPPDPLPAFTADLAVMISAFLRGGVFGMLEKGKRGTWDNDEIASQNSYSIKATGEMLDEYDRDTYFGVTNAYAGVIPGMTHSVPVRAMLRAIGRQSGTFNRVALAESLRRIAMLRLEIEIDTPRIQATYQGSILNLIRITDKEDQDGGGILYSIPPEFIRFFWRDYSKVNLRERHAITGRGSQLAKWLHAYYSSHKIPYPVKVATLKEWSRSKLQDLHAFRFQLKQALKLLEEKGYLHSWKITPDDDLVTIFKNDAEPHQYNFYKELEGH